MRQLTEKQKALLRLIEQYERERDFPPTPNDLAKQLGESRQLIRYILMTMQKRGVIKIYHGIPVSLTRSQVRNRLNEIVSDLEYGGYSAISRSEIFYDDIEGRLKKLAEMI